MGVWGYSVHSVSQEGIDRIDSFFTCLHADSNLGKLKATSMLFGCAW